LGSLLLVLTALSGGCASDKKTLVQANQFDSGLKPAEIADPEINAYFQQIGRRIVLAAREADAGHFGPSKHFDKKEPADWMFDVDKIRFHLVNSQTLNAFTTGGEHVYVYYALFQNCQNEDDLAAVMSHEFGHVYSRHVQKGNNRQLAIMVGEGAAGAAGYLAGGSELSTQGTQLSTSALTFANMGFTRGDEAEADAVGFHFYYHAGWDPAQFDHFFKTMIALGYDKTPAVQSDHPTLASRVEASEKRIKELPADAVGKFRQPRIREQAAFDQIKARAAQVAANSPNDQSLANTKQLLQALPRSCWVPYEPDDQKQAQQDIAQKVKQNAAP
jgi:predicted Zn-dependent protease